MEENKTIVQYDPSRARVSLIRMLTELSEDALDYVWRPIVYAYNWVDAHDMNSMTKDDDNRLGLLVDMTYGPSEVVSLINKFGCEISCAWYDREVKACTT